ncbi:expressed unknown protein [Seminavis robusta]|uniref:Uncharacterized protein n=1 Tax=Seminavis robusta TaxID=568900 RepID=A0A9N8EAL0_9STRA|nr:expressed unknown protein [Seminavis robusta]|eukprot:Sro888_g216480.1 n/a (262) ;mRNA; f:31035-31820
MIGSTLSIQPDTLIECTVIRPTRRLSDFVTGLSSRRLTLLPSANTSNSIRSLDSSSSSIRKKRVRFGSILEEKHEYPAAASLTHKSDLWYPMGELQESVAADIDSLHFYQYQQRFQAPGEASEPEPDSDELSTTVEQRGLEFYMEDQIHRRHSVRHYVHMVIMKSRQSPTAKRFSLVKGSSNVSTSSTDSVTRYSLQFTAHAKDVAFRQAMEDEVDARRIYLADGTVQSSTDFAAKSTESLKRKAMEATAGPRSSITAMSA